MDNWYLIYHITASECGNPGHGGSLDIFPNCAVSRQKERIQSPQRKDKLCGILQ